jgi:hypothetical protein
VPRRALPWLAVAGLFVVLALVGRESQQQQRKAPLNVLVLTVESWRADALAAAPELLRLAARKGIRYEDHRAVSAWTGTNALTLLTGLSPFQHNIQSRGQTVDEQQELPLETLADAGWRVAGLQAFMRIPLFNQLGLGREGVAGEIGQQPHDWLRARAASGEPFFLWYHYLHTHLPYRPSPDFDVDWQALLPPGRDAGERFAALRRRGRLETGTVVFEAEELPAIRALYDAGIAEFDAWFAGLWAALEESGLDENTVIVVTADHGEELLERGEVGHASTTLAGHLHEELVRLPLMLFLPPGVAGPAPGSVITAPSDHRDVMTTLLALLGQAVPQVLQGEDLRRLPRTRPWSGVTSRAGYSEPEPDSPSAMIYARREGRWKLHVSEPGEGPALYDLAADPDERTNVAEANPAVVAGLMAGLADERAQSLPSADRPTVAGAGPRPRWLRPSASGVFGYDRIGGRFLLQWDGPPEADYVLAYRYRDGAGWLEGEIPVSGTVYDFGAIDRRYWDTWVVPNGPYRVRVGYAGPDPRWSEWLELIAR